MSKDGTACLKTAYSFLAIMHLLVLYKTSRCRTSLSTSLVSVLCFVIKLLLYFRVIMLQLLAILILLDNR